MKYYVWADGAVLAGVEGPKTPAPSFFQPVPLGYDSKQVENGTLISHESGSEWVSELSRGFKRGEQYESSYDE